MTGSLESEVRNLKPGACPRPRTGARTILISGFRFLTSVFLISVFSLLISAPAAQAACSNPAGNLTGNIDMFYNKDYHVYTYCDGTNWKPMGPAGAGGSGCGNVSSTGLVGYWKLDEASSGTTPTTTADSSGTGNAGTLINSPTWTTGKVNNALTLASASSQSVNVPDAPSLDISGSWTVASWVNLTSIPASGLKGKMIDRDDSILRTNYSIAVVNNTGGCASAGWRVAFNDTATATYQTCYVTTVNTGTWYHVTGVWDSSTSNLMLYLNGSLVATQNFAGHVPTSATGTYLDLGQQGSGLAYLDGTIDDARVYNRALSAAEVTSLYNIAFPGVEGDLMYNNDYHVPQFCDGKNWQPMGPTSACSGCAPSSGLVGYWKLDESSGTSAADSSGNGNTGTVTPNATGVWVAGEINKAANLNGTTQYVVAANAGSLGGMTGLTVAAWVYVVNGTAPQAILSKRNSVAPWYSYALEISSNNLDFQVVNSLSAEAGAADNTGIVPNNQWFHVVGVYDGSKVWLYLNGALYGWQNALTGTVFVSNGQLNMGAVDDGTYFLNGKIDDVRIYNRALSATEITALYNYTGAGGSGCASPAGVEGNMFYNSDFSVMEYCNGSSWVRIGQ